MRTQQKNELSVQRPDAGFGLVSVMVAIVLLSVGVLSLSQLLTQSVSMQTIIPRQAGQVGSTDVRNGPGWTVSDSATRISWREPSSGG